MIINVINRTKKEMKIRFFGQSAAAKSAAYILFHTTVRRVERGAHITVRKDLRSDNYTSFSVLAHKAVRGLENNRKEEVTHIHS